jgi:DNA-binding protein H-NS
MATLDQLQSKIQKLQHQAEALIAKNASKVIGEIRTLMERHGLTTADIDAHGANGAKRVPKAASKAAAKPVKATTVAEGTVAKGQRKGPQPAKYRNPKTGETWSGRGPAPAWLASVKDRSKFLIAASAEKNAAPVDVKNAAPAKKAKSAVKSAVATKKVASKKAMPAKPVAPTKAVPKKPVAKAAAAAENAVNTKVAAKKGAAKKAGASPSSSDKPAATSIKKVAAKKAVSAKKVTAKSVAKSTASANSKQTPAKKAVVAKKPAARAAGGDALSSVAVNAPSPTLK